MKTSLLKTPSVAFSRVLHRKAGDALAYTFTSRYARELLRGWSKGKETDASVRKAYRVAQTLAGVAAVAAVVSVANDTFSGVVIGLGSALIAERTRRILRPAFNLASAYRAMKNAETHHHATRNTPSVKGGLSRLDTAVDGFRQAACTYWHPPTLWDRALGVKASPSIAPPDRLVRALRHIGAAERPSNAN